MCIPRKRMLSGLFPGGKEMQNLPPQQIIDFRLNVGVVVGQLVWERGLVSNWVWKHLSDGDPVRDRQRSFPSKLEYRPDILLRRDLH